MSAAMASGREAAVRAMRFLQSRSVGFFLRSLSNASAPETTTAETGLGEANKSKKRRKKKNLFEVAQFLPNWGVGYQMAKSHWNGTSYKITKINLYKDGRHGKAWGVFHKDGVHRMPSAEEKKISGVHKRGWRYIPESRKKLQPVSVLEISTLAS